MIITNEKLLRTVCKKADFNESHNIIKKLDIELKNHNGIGLAAPQIGIYKRIVIIRNSIKLNLVNPIIINRNKMFLSKNEGCLSIPNFITSVWRFKEILVKDDIHPNGFVATDLDAFVIQHEIDHLDGILISDKSFNKIGRNSPCPCGAIKNGKPIKFKKCHGR